MARATIYVFAKPPRAGVSKTRLAVSVGPEMAATYARAFLHDVWDVVVRVPSAQTVLAVTENAAEAYGLGDSIETVPQGEGDLGARMARVLAHGLSRGETAIIVGSDCPGVGVETFTRVLAALETHDAFLAPTDDGGFYLVGVRRCPDGIFDGVPWSVPTTFAETRARMEALGLRVAVGEPWLDVDDAEGLEVLRLRMSDEPERASNAPRTQALLTRDADRAKAALARAIAEVYRAFAHRPLARGFPEACSPVGERRDLARRLMAAPLAELGVEPLVVYCFKAMSTMGDPEDFLYFLPRMIELYATDPAWHEHSHDLWVKARPLRASHMTKAEVAAVDAVEDAMWACFSSGADVGVRIATFLEDTWTSEQIAVRLRAWRPSASEVEISAVLDLLEGGWYCANDVRAVVASWAKDKRIVDLLNAAYASFEKGPLALRMLYVIERLEFDLY